MKAAGDSQLYAGHISSCDAGVHAMADTQVDDQTEAVLLIDARNVFNFLNREAAMKNIQIGGGGGGARTSAPPEFTLGQVQICGCQI